MILKGETALPEKMAGEEGHAPMNPERKRECQEVSHSEGCKVAKVNSAH